MLNGFYRRHGAAGKKNKQKKGTQPVKTDDFATAFNIEIEKNEKTKSENKSDISFDKILSDDKAKDLVAAFTEPTSKPQPKPISKPEPVKKNAPAPKPELKIVSI